jgi:hypothetical protein
MDEAVIAPVEAPAPTPAATPDLSNEVREIRDLVEGLHRDTGKYEIPALERVRKQLAEMGEPS